MRILEKLGIRYELREYDVDPDDLSAGTVAAKIGIPPMHLFKTLAVQGDRNWIYLAVIPATEAPTICPEPCHHFPEARFLKVRVGYNPIRNGRRRGLRTLVRQSASRAEAVLCVLPESVLFGVYRRRRSSH